MDLAELSAIADKLKLFRVT